MGYTPPRETGLAGGLRLELLSWLKFGAYTKAICHCERSEAIAPAQSPGGPS
jgi:hypothetical protein